MRLQLVLGAALLAGAVQAQESKPGPDVRFESIKNSAGRTYEDFAGRLILLEQFAHW